MLAVDAVNKSNSRHPGLPMGCAPMGYALWRNILVTSNNPKWFNRDRFVLSTGHGCMLLYSLLHLTGYKSVSIEDIKNLDNGDPKLLVSKHLKLKEWKLRLGLWSWNLQRSWSSNN